MDLRLEDAADVQEEEENNSDEEGGGPRKRGKDIPYKEHNTVIGSVPRVKI